MRRHYEKYVTDPKLKSSRGRDFEQQKLSKNLVEDSCACRVFSLGCTGLCSLDFGLLDSTGPNLGARGTQIFSRAENDDR